MKPTSLQATLIATLCVASSAFGILVSAAVTAAEPASPNAAAATAAPAAHPGSPETFDSPEQAADAMISAAEKFDVPSLLKMVGHDGEDVVLTGEFSQDRERAQAFAAQARIKKRVSIDAKTNTARLLVGEGNGRSLCRS